MRVSGPEAILGATALVLVVWLLWPEGSTPKLDQRATWEKHLKEAERQRLSRNQSSERRFEKTATLDRQSEVGTGQTSEVVERRLLAKPSELADRVRFSNLENPAARPEVFPSLEQAPSYIVDALPDETTELAKAAKQEAGGEVASLADSVQAVAPKPEEQLAAFDRTSIVTAALSSDGFDVESTGSGDVRMRPRDDAPSWLRNAVAASLTDDRPVIAVVLDDLGLNRSSTKALNSLPAPLTLAFLPYAGKIKAQTEAAKQAGHELLVHMPMEPFGSAWPGPEALLTSLDQDEFVRRLNHNLDQISGYVGVNNHMGSRLTSDRGRMDLVMRELRNRDVLFLDSRTTPRSVASDMASRNGVPNTTRDIFLDHVIDINKIRDQMSKVEYIARQTGSAVAIGHPHGATIEALSSWLPQLSARGFVLAPISAVLARRACQDGLLIAAETCGRYLYAGKPIQPGLTAGDG